MSDTMQTCAKDRQQASPHAVRTALALPDRHVDVVRAGSNVQV